MKSGVVDQSGVLESDGVSVLCVFDGNRGELVEMQRRIVLEALPERMVGVDRDLRYDGAVIDHLNAALKLFTTERPSPFVVRILAIDVRRG